VNLGGGSDLYSENFEVGEKLDIAGDGGHFRFRSILL
jgi:hypothetical protein